MKNYESNSNFHQKYPQNKQLFLLKSQFQLDQPHLLPGVNSICIKGHQAFLVCMNIKCKIQNPFICYQRNCQCSDSHFNCSQKRLDYLLKIVQSRKKHNSQKQSVIDQLFQGIQEKLSKQWDRIILKVKQLSTDQNKNNFKNNQQIQNVTGSNISKLFQQGKVQKQKQKHKEMLKSLQKRAKTFKQNEFKKFIEDIEKLVFDDKKVNFEFSLNKMSECLQRVQKTGLKCIKKSYKLKFGLMEPKICQLQNEENILKWRIKIEKITGSMAIGICSKKTMQRKEYQIINDRLEMSQINCFLLQPYKRDMERINAYGQQQMKIKNGDVITIIFNKNDNLLQYHNKKLGQQEPEIHILDCIILKKNKKDYYLSIGIQKQGDELNVIYQGQKNIQQGNNHLDETQQMKLKNFSPEVQNLSKIKISSEDISLNSSNWDDQQQIHQWALSRTKNKNEWSLTSQ